MRALCTPNGTSFSNATKTVNAAMTARFITLPANKSSISAQQQPTQYAPCSRPIRNAPANPLRHRLIKNPSGDWHVRRQACLIGVN
jgi:hypothetical protein